MKYSVIVDLDNKTKSGFSKIEKSLDGLKKKSEKTTSSLGKMAGPAMKVAKAIAKIVLAAVALAGALAVMIVKNTTVISQMSQQARVAGLGAEEFQRLAYAASTVGVEQDKLSDILKDVNDKVGDFMATGAGPMADFFENIAPKVGVTAEQFANLSGPDALQLYVKSLEAANVSQAEMTFYMEAIASDATALIPLLENNGVAMAGFADEAERLGLVLSNVDVSRITEANKSVNKLKSVFSAFGDQLTAGFAPALKVVSDYFAELSTKYLPGVASGAETMARVTIMAIGTVIDGVSAYIDTIQMTVTAMQLAGDGIKLLWYGIEEIVAAVINTTIDGINKLTSAVNSITGNRALMSFISPGSVLMGMGGTDIGQIPNVETSGGFAEARTSGAGNIDDMQTHIDSLTANLTGNGNGRQVAEMLLENMDAFKDTTAAAQIAADTMDALGMNSDGTTDAVTTLADTLTSTAGPALSTIADVIDPVAEKFDALQGKIRGVGDTLTKDLATALRTGQGLWESFGNFFDGIMDMILQKMMEIIVVKPLMDSLFGEMGGFGGSGDGIFGKVLGGIFGARATGGPVAAGRPYMVGENGPELFNPSTSGVITPSAASLGMLNNGGGNVYSPVFNTTIQTSGGDTQDPQKAKRFADEFNKTVEAKVATTIAKMQNGRGMQSTGTNY